MPEEDEDFGGLLAAGLLVVGVGLLAAAAAKNHNDSKRAAFRQGLEAALRVHGVVLLGATLGRQAGNRLFWDVTVQNQTAQIWTQRIELSAGVEAYSQTTRDVIVQNLA